MTRYATDQEEAILRGDLRFIRCRGCGRAFVYGDADRQVEDNTTFVVCPCGRRQTLRIDGAGP